MLPELSRIRMSLVRLLVKAKSLIFYTLKGHREVQGKTLRTLLKRMGENDPSEALTEF